MKEMTLEARQENVRELTAMVVGELEKLDCPMKAQMQIELAIDEIFTNIVSYAYVPGTGDATVRFDFDEASGMVILSFADRGVPYDPLKKEDPFYTVEGIQAHVPHFYEKKVSQMELGDSNITLGSFDRK